MPPTRTPTTSPCSASSRRVEGSDTALSLTRRHPSTLSSDRCPNLLTEAGARWVSVLLASSATVPVDWTASGEEEAKDRKPAAGFKDSPKSNSSCLVVGCCEACGQPPTCGQGGGNALRFPRLIHRAPRWRGQAGIGAADCPQIHSTTSASRQAASAVAAIDWPR